MLYFPQLTTLTVAQYPVNKERSARTILNETIEGRITIFQDFSSLPVRWDLSFTGLTQAERSALEDLFAQSEGRLRPFVFADPLRNLLARSEELDQAPWQSDPLLQLTPGLADPTGGNRAVRVLNIGAGLQSLGQSIELPGDYYCSFSIHVRAASPATIELARLAGSERQSSMVEAGPAWRRVQFGSKLVSSAAPTRFEVTVASGESIELFGAQVDAQPSPGSYSRTAAASGIHTKARFAQDQLVVMADSVDSFSARVTIVSPGEVS
ncbi:MAG: hypothetical protein R2762_10355 [Bryobacteraceae bacterium]